jgi:hypothetical protein
LEHAFHDGRTVAARFEGVRAMQTDASRGHPGGRHRRDPSWNQVSVRVDRQAGGALGIAMTLFGLKREDTRCRRTKLHPA